MGLIDGKTEVSMDGVRDVSHLVRTVRQEQDFKSAQRKEVI